MSKQSISIADQLFYGRGAYGRANQGRRGIQVNLLRVHSFGAPAAAAAAGIAASQTITSPAAGVINGSLASGGVATFDIARNIVAAWTNTAIITFTGTDVYGETIKESSASGTSFAGKKAFKTITAIAINATVTGFTAGSGDVLGLPIRVSANGLLAARAANAIDAGTFVPADTTTATATTGDTRGTFDPAVALNASNTVQVLLYCSDPSTKDGAYGIAQFAG